MQVAGPFRIEVDGERLMMTTGSFRAEKGSVLHSGIFNRELASSFVAAGTALLFLFVVSVLSGRPTAAHYAGAAAVIVIIFPLCRVFVFRETRLRLVIDRAAGTIGVTRQRFIGARRISMPLRGLREVALGEREFDPRNQDAVEFVGKIALQHGMVVPGFGDVERYRLVELVFDDERVTVFASKSARDAEAVREALGKFAFDGREGAQGYVSGAAEYTKNITR